MDTVPEQAPGILAAVAHLGPVLAGQSWSAELGIALVHLLHLHEIAFADGYVLNGDDFQSAFGLSDAAMVVSHLCSNPQESWQWWRTAASPGSLSSDRMERLIDQLTTTIQANPGVRWVR